MNYPLQNVEDMAATVVWHNWAHADDFMVRQYSDRMESCQGQWAGSDSGYTLLALSRQTESARQVD